jgi:hypothetical protein
MLFFSMLIFLNQIGPFCTHVLPLKRQGQENGMETLPVQWKIWITATFCL